MTACQYCILDHASQRYLLRGMLCKPCLTRSRCYVAQTLCMGLDAVPATHRISWPTSRPWSSAACCCNIASCCYCWWCPCCYCCCCCWWWWPMLRAFHPLLWCCWFVATAAVAVFHASVVIVAMGTPWQRCCATSGPLWDSSGGLRSFPQAATGILLCQ